MEIKNLLARLSNAHGISGYEDEIREIVRKELEGYVDEVRIDALGNVICIKNGSKLELMLAAHMDEIGFMVKYIDEKGFIRITPIGGWFDQTVLGQRVVLHGKRKVFGVIGCKPPHLMKEDEAKKMVKIGDMFVDIGANSKEEVQEIGVEIGTPVTVDREFVQLGGKRVTGKAFDDRVGVVAMVEALRQTKSDATIYAVATVQEEVGLKGARTSAFALEPHAAIALDVCITTDFPGTESAHLDVKLGKGAAITVVDAAGRGLIASKKVIEWLKTTAEKYSIPYQMEVAERGTTDATAIQLTRAGIPTGVVSVPARYIHSPIEVIDLEDLKNASLLVARAVERAGEYFT
jgi:endoglucanase